MPATPQSLAARFNLPGLSFEADQGGLVVARVRTELAEADVYLHGGHVTHFKPEGQQEPVLFLSDSAVFREGKAIRGGIPVCFPWFGPKADAPDAPSHGVVRTAEWELVNARITDGAIELELETDSSAAADTLRAAGFAGSYLHNFLIRVGPELSIHSTVTNTGESNLEYELALHTYLRVGEARRVAIGGFDGSTFIDQLQGNARQTEQGEPSIEGEVDRIYQGHQAAVTLADPVLNRTLRIAKTGGGSTVLWNPHVDKAHRLADLGDNEWPNFICVESAAIGEHAVRLNPGAKHTLSATISVE